MRLSIAARKRPPEAADVSRLEAERLPSFRFGLLERFQEKWHPVFSPKARQSKTLRGKNSRLRQVLTPADAAFESGRDIIAVAQTIDNGFGNPTGRGGVA